MTIDPKTLDFAKSDGLIPVIVQNALNLRVLMLGYMNEDALNTTQETGYVTFFSRSKKRLWKKGETSGNVLKLECVKQDCDSDTLLILAHPAGPTCHTGSESCFTNDDKGMQTSLSLLDDLSKIIKERKENPTTNSYTASLFKAGMPRMAQKVGEEGVEVALASVSDPDHLASESADLIYHLLVLLEASDLCLNDVLKVLAKRSNH